MIVREKDGNRLKVAGREQRGEEAPFEGTKMLPTEQYIREVSENLPLKSFTVTMRMECVG